MNKVQIKYPTWKVRGHPTPNECLMICDNCGIAEWTMDIGHNVYTCDHRTCHVRKGGAMRMRVATKKEREQALKALKQII